MHFCLCTHYDILVSIEEDRIFVLKLLSLNWQVSPTANAMIYRNILWHMKIYKMVCVHNLLLYFQSTKFLWIDDVYVTGFLRRNLNITMINTGKYQILGAKKLLKRKSILSPNLYLNDYINTLVGRGQNEGISNLSNF